MTLFTPLSGSPSALSDAGVDGPYRELYGLLYSNDPQAATRGEQFLREQLALAAELPCDLPEEPGQVCRHGRNNIVPMWRVTMPSISRARKQGGARRYFSNKAHALYFLQRVSPTKKSTVHGWPGGAGALAGHATMTGC